MELSEREVRNLALKARSQIRRDLVKIKTASRYILLPANARIAAVQSKLTNIRDVIDEKD